MHLPDINFWLALTFQSHENHVSAKAWMNSAARQSCCFCRVTQMGFLRLATNRKVFLLDALPINEAWRVYDQLLSDVRVVFAEESEDGRGRVANRHEAPDFFDERLERRLPGSFRAGGRL